MIESKNLIQKEGVDAVTIIHSTLTESLNLISTTSHDAEIIIHHMVEDDHSLEHMASIEIEHLKASVKVESENLNRLAESSITNIENIINIELQNTQNYARIISENISRTAEIKITNMFETAKISSENLQRSVQINSANLKELAKIHALNLMRTAEKESENLKQTANTVSVNLMTRVNIAILSMQKIAISTSDKLKESSRIHSINTVTKTYDTMSNLTKITPNKLQIKNMKRVISIIIVSFIAVTSGFLYLNSQYSAVVSPAGSLSSNYLIENLKGDQVDTWVSWKIPADTQFHIHVLNSNYVTKERLDAIIDTIMSQQKIELDDSVMYKGPKGTTSTYYVGWYGALNSIKSDTKFNIPKNLHFSVDDSVATGNVEIELTNLSNPDGYSAYTKSIVDEVNHQILKSVITVYDIDKINLEDLKTLLRHELGHGFGLTHSTVPEDLMAPVITTNYPYISSCDLSAVTYLYNGGESSKVICEK